MNGELYFVTGNDGKFEEVQACFNYYNSEIKLIQDRTELHEKQTLDQKAIAIEKARQAWAVLQKPLIVDDSGIYFDKFNKFPGSLSKFIYHGIGREGILRLVDVGDPLTFVIFLVYIDGPDSYHVFEGRRKGRAVIPKEFIARPDLPFDDIFVPEGIDKSYAQMRGTEEMFNYFYRLRAIKKLIDWFCQRECNK